MGVRLLTLEKMILSYDLEGKARTHPDIFRVVLSPYMQYCPCEASKQKLEQKPNSELIGHDYNMYKIHIYIDSKSFRHIQ